MEGFIIYTVNANDTIFSIANKFCSRISSIFFANPGINSDLIYPGQKLIVPVGEIVPINIPYTYQIMQNNLHSLNVVYPFLQISSIGYSVLGRDISVVKIGRGDKQVFYNASFHANEWITSVLLMKFIENFCMSYVTNSNIFGYSTRNIFDTCSIYIAPMINPDGVDFKIIGIINL